MAEVSTGLKFNDLVLNLDESINVPENNSVSLSLSNTIKDEDREALSFTKFKIEGIVVDENNDPLDATIIFYRWSDGAFLSQVVTGEGGFYSYSKFIENDDVLVSMKPNIGNIRPLSHGPVTPIEKLF